MKFDSLASDLLQMFFQKMNENNISYAVLRNYEGLPHRNNSKDVDIVISPESQTTVVELLTNASKSLDYQLIWYNPLDYLDGFVFVKLINTEIFSVKIDLFIGFKWHGCHYVNHDFIFEKCNTYNGFKVPNKGHEAFIMIVYYILYAKNIKGKYHNQIFKNANDNLVDFEGISREMISKKTTNKILDLVKNNKIDGLVNLRNNIRNEIINYNIKKNPILINYVRHFKTEVLDRRNMGVLIAFSGPDGAGKSTLVSVIMELFYSLGISTNQTPHHFLTENIPSLHKLPGAPKKYAKQDYTKPYQAKPAGLINSILRTAYYYFAFLADRLLNINRMLRTNEIVLFDRYYTDMIVDPSRIRISLSKNLIQKLFRTLPKPNFTFIVLASKEQILKRKDELDENKLVELLNEYSKIPHIIKNSHILYNTGTLDQGKLLLCKSVFNKLEKLYIKK